MADPIAGNQSTTAVSNYSTTQDAIDAATASAVKPISDTTTNLSALTIANGMPVYDTDLGKAQVMQAGSLQNVIGAGSTVTVLHADDYGSLQACYDDLPTAGGKILLGPSTYGPLDCTATENKTSVIIQGEGPRLSIIAGGTERGIDCGGFDKHLVLKDLQVTRSDTSGTGYFAILMNGIDPSLGGTFMMENCWVETVDAPAMEVQWMAKVVIRDCTIKSPHTTNSRDALWMHANYDVAISGNTITAGLGRAIYASNCARIAINGNPYLYSVSGYALHITCANWATYSAQILGNYINSGSTTDGAILLNTSNGTLWRVNIMCNAIYAPSAANQAVNLSDVSYSSIVHNMIEYKSGATIIAESGSTSVTTTPNNTYAHP